LSGNGDGEDGQSASRDRLGYLDIIQGGKWLLRCIANATFIEEFYYNKLKRYVKANDWEKNSEILLAVMYEVVGIKANDSLGQLELSADNVLHKNILKNEQLLISLF
jgi:hypothetical protein